MLLALIYAACAGGGHLRTVAALRADPVARQACGLQAVPHSQRLGEHLQRMHQAALEGLRRCGWSAGGWCRWGRRRARSGGGPSRCSWTARGSRGESQLCENAERGYHGEQ